MGKCLFLSVILTALSPETIPDEGTFAFTVPFSASNKLNNPPCASAEVTSNGLSNNEDSSYH